MTQYKKVTEFTRLLRDIERIDNKTQFNIVERKIEDANKNKRINYAEYHALLELLLKKSEVMVLKSSKPKTEGQPDYLSSFSRKWKKHKLLAVVFIAITAIILIANFLGALAVLHDFVVPPTANLDIAIYGWTIYPTYNNDNTTIIGLNATFPSHITNIGKIPVHIVVFDVFLDKNGKPLIEGNSNESISEIMYLKPQDSFSYNFTKSFAVSIPAKPMTLDTLNQLNSYYLLVGCRENSQDIKQIWKEVKVDWLK